MRQEGVFESILRDLSFFIPAASACSKPGQLVKARDIFNAKRLNKGKMNIKKILTVLTLGLTLTSATVWASPGAKKEQKASALVGLSSGATVAMADVASNGELWMLTWLLERFGRESVVSSLSHGDNGDTNHILASAMSWGSYYVTHTLFNERINPGQPPLNKIKYLAMVSFGLVAAIL